ncbi:predicted protein [Botrytis cinerea T4]|uniref:Uncharacterized protein n=1 Tax=Botryotinia fuckeliana (strain T4) TaxID=999810 RepID=G2Y5N4_BOTF4|nr:predicted protein [Botrytis cinerea T4]
MANQGVKGYRLTRGRGSIRKRAAYLGLSRLPTRAYR